MSELGRYCFTDGKIEAQKGKAPCVMSHSDREMIQTRTLLRVKGALLILWGIVAVLFLQSEDRILIPFPFLGGREE